MSSLGATATFYACPLPAVACRLSLAACRLPLAACRLSLCRLPPAACRYSSRSTTIGSTLVARLAGM
jgi:hypothetical protein